MMLQDFLGGAVTMGFAVAALMFLGFWRRSRENLFLAFAGSFALLAINQALIALTHIALEERSWLYLVRLAAFLLIIWAIWQHNRRTRPRRWLRAGRAGNRQKTEAQMMSQLPEGLTSYRRTPLFNETSVPTGLLKDHSTKDETWGLIHVEEGSLRYVVTDPRRPRSERILTLESAPGVVEPTILHHVEPIGPVCFYVEFLRR